MTLYNQFIEGKSSRPDNLNLRLHRALSWLAKAEKLKDDNTPLAKPLRHLWGDICNTSGSIIINTKLKFN